MKCTPAGNSAATCRQGAGLLRRMRLRGRRSSPTTGEPEYATRGYGAPDSRTGPTRRTARLAVEDSLSDENPGTASDRRHAWRRNSRERPVDIGTAAPAVRPGTAATSPRLPPSQAHTRSRAEHAIAGSPGAGRCSWTRLIPRHRRICYPTMNRREWRVTGECVVREEGGEPVQQTWVPLGASPGFADDEALIMTWRATGPAILDELVCNALRTAADTRGNVRGHGPCPGPPPGHSSRSRSGRSPRVANPAR